MFLVFIAALLFYFTFRSIIQWIMDKSANKLQRGYVSSFYACPLIRFNRFVKDKVIQYFSEYWNIFYFATHCKLHFIYAKYKQPELLIIKTIKCIIVLFAFIKVTFFVRIFEEFSFLVQIPTSFLKIFGSFYFSSRYWLQPCSRCQLWLGISLKTEILNCTYTWTGTVHIYWWRSERQQG